jgi:hypothetical protein
MHYKIRRPREVSEVLNYQQAKTIGRRYCVSSVDSPSAVKASQSIGFTHVFVKRKWKSIDSFVLLRHGGNNAGSNQKVRPRHPVNSPKKSRASQKGVLKASARIALSIAYIVNLPHDGSRRSATKSELRNVFPALIVPRGIHGKRYVHRSVSVEGNCNHTLVKLNDAGRRMLGVSSLTVVSRVRADAAAVFGCAISHRRLFNQVRCNPSQAGQWVFVFEDDVYLRYPSTDVRVMISEVLWRVGHAFDIIWFGATNPIFASERFLYRRLNGVDFEVRRIAGTYGSFAYAVRKPCLMQILPYWDPRSIIHTSDGALRKSLSVLRGGCCVPQLVAHRAASETGGSRIHSS